MSRKESFLLYWSMEELLLQLSPDELQTMIFAMFQYSRTGQDPQLSGSLNAVWITFRRQFERDAEKYQRICDRNKANGIQGGRPSKTPNNPEKPSGLFGLKNKPKKPDTLISLNTELSNDNNNFSAKNEFSPECEPVSSCYSFSEFWDDYGKKKNRPRCEKIYAKISEIDRAAIKAQLPAYIDSTLDIQFRMYPEKYLNGKRWLDEITSGRGLTSLSIKRSGGNFATPGDEAFLESWGTPKRDYTGI